MEDAHRELFNDDIVEKNFTVEERGVVNKFISYISKLEEENKLHNTVNKTTAVWEHILFLEKTIQELNIRLGQLEQKNGVPSNISGLANSGNAYNFPSFKIVRTSGTISQVQATYGGKTVTWIGTLDATYDSLIIDQRNGHALRYSGGNLTDYLDYSGVIALDAGVSGQSMSITVYGGNATVSVLSRARFW